ncbi:MAG: Uma2 family endonuclease [Chloroflexi bacterium]|nr:Uma2 family endonuclease [Chloroflexota bacterium]MCY4246483.1 Uma2 family endonuclease [Chloroflexota bacterium]
MRETIMDASAQIDQQRRFTVADMWRLARLPEYADCRYELVEGELREMSPVGELHGYLASVINRLLGNYIDEMGAGRVTIETGYYELGDDETVLAPDIAFRRVDTKANPPTSSYVMQMPDLAAEIKSPGDSYAYMRRKAELYLRRGTRVVWLVYPERRGVDVCDRDETGAVVFAFIDETGSLSGGDALPGFILELRRLFT